MSFVTQWNHITGGPSWRIRQLEDGGIPSRISCTGPQKNSFDRIICGNVANMTQFRAAENRFAMFDYNWLAPLGSA